MTAMMRIAAALGAVSVTAAQRGPWRPPNGPKPSNGPGRPGSWKVDTFVVLYME